MVSLGGGQKPCLTLSHEARAAVDGIELTLTDHGGLRDRTRMISGMELRSTECAPARFETAVLPRPRSHSRLVISDGRRQAVLEADYLLGPPPMHVDRTSVRPNETVTVTLESDAEPDAPDYDVRSTIRLLRPGTGGQPGVSHWVDDEGFRWKDGRFTFVMPDVPPGPLSLIMMPTYHDEATITKCTGLQGCTAYPVQPTRRVELEILAP